jgi:hypothetical protein
MPDTNPTTEAIAADPLLDQYHRDLLTQLYPACVNVTAIDRKSNGAVDRLICSAGARTSLTCDELEAAIRAALDQACESGVYEQFGFLMRWLAHVNSACGIEFVDFMERTAE